MLHTDVFGYRSIHFIVKIKNYKLKKQEYKDLRGLKAEIQIRTILMNAHADIEHQLTYKNPTYIPHKFKRKLSQTSAILEVVDEQFDQLKEDMEKYYGELHVSMRKDDFNLDQELNIDTLQDFLDYIFPEREKIPAKTAGFFDRIKRYNDDTEVDKISLETLLFCYMSVKVDLADLERKSFAWREGEYKWDQAQCLENILDLAQP